MRFSPFVGFKLLLLALIVGTALAPRGAAAADEAVAGEDDDFFKTDEKPKAPDVPDASAFNSDEEFQIAAPIEIVAPPPKPVAAPVGPSRLGLDLNGKTPLADNWGPTIAFTTVDSVVIEIPVLYAVNGAGFDGNAYWLVAEVYSDGKKIGEQRTQVMKETVSAKGASVQFFRFFTPVGTPAGVLEVKVSKIASGSTKPGLLFTRSVSYSL